MLIVKSLWTIVVIKERAFSSFFKHATISSTQQIENFRYH